MPLVSGSCFALFAVSIMLLFFSLQQMYQISINVTQIEKEKYSDIEARRKRSRIFEPVINIYDKGFFGNWLEFLFPPKIKKNKYD